MIYNLSNNENFQKAMDESSNIITFKFCKNNYVTRNNQKYRVIRYDKNYLSHDLVSTQGLFRSVIVNQDKRVVCFAPPKSYRFHSFLEKYPDLINTDGIVAEEFVEGTMVNVFWDPSASLSGCWEIATRNSVGGEVKFFQTQHAKTFREMFMEAANDNNLDINNLNKNYCYSFVLQHPENRIVVPFRENKLYLTSVYEICNTENGTVTVNCIDLKTIKETEEMKMTNVKYPDIYTDWTSHNDLIDKYCSQNTSYNILGVVIHNYVTGERTKIRNPVYENVRQLRGNQPKLQFQYLALRKEGKVGEYLNYYSEHKKEFSVFRDQMHGFTNALFQNYISCYIKKQKPLKDFPDNFKTHMFNIHRIYIDNLRIEKKYVNHAFVIEFVNNLPLTLQMYSLNYAMRKRNKDVINIKLEEDGIEVSV